ncbi:MAG: ribonuclease III [Clostridia bacterium]|nr:ribonuclease III [Clostridia bacterium]
MFEHNMLPGSLELAYMGDAIYDLYVRERLVKKGGRVQAMHRSAIKQVCAHAQAEALGRIEEELTEAEAGVVRRARNASQKPPKNADAGEYHRATALEALIGYLYLSDQHARMDELIRKALPEENTEDAHEKG